MPICVCGCRDASCLHICRCAHVWRWYARAWVARPLGVYWRMWRLMACARSARVPLRVVPVRAFRFARRPCLRPDARATRASGDVGFGLHPSEAVFRSRMDGGRTRNRAGSILPGGLAAQQGFHRKTGRAKLFVYARCAACARACILTGRMAAVPWAPRLGCPLGATGFDAIVLREEAGRGLLATLNRGTVKLN